MKIFKFAILIITAIYLGGCASPKAANDISISQTPLATKTSTLHPTTPTFKRTPWPSSTPMPSPTPLPPPINPPPGILYRNPTGNMLWLTQNDATDYLLFEGPEGSSIWPSTDLKMVTYIQYPPSDSTTYVPNRQFLVDLLSGNSQQILPIPERNLCTFQFAGKESNLMVNILMEPDGDPGYWCRGSPVIATLKGTSISEMKYLDEKSVTWEYPKISPDAKRLAFDIKGKPYIYFIHGSTFPFQFNKYNLPGLKNPYFFGPVWSPSGRYLAWDVSSENDQMGVAIFDLDQRSATYSSDHRVLRWEVYYGLVFWSADEEYLAIYHPEIGYFALINRNGDTLQRFDKMKNYFMWAPVGHYYATSRYIDGNSLLSIGAPDSLDIIEVGLGDFTAWNPKGDALIFERDDMYWLYDMQTKTSSPLALPKGAQIIEWRDINTTTTP